MKERDINKIHAIIDNAINEMDIEQLEFLSRFFQKQVELAYELNILKD